MNSVLCHGIDERGTTYSKTDILKCAWLQSVEGQQNWAQYLYGKSLILGNKGASPT